MMWAKQSTAATVIIGPVLDSTGAEYASAVIGDLSISKNGGTLTALASAATLTLIANGQYTLVLTTANVDTLGRAQITCNKSTYQVPSIELMVLPATVYDAIVTNAVNATGGLVGATAAITTMAGVIATATNITAGTITTVTNLTNAPTSGDLTATMKASVTAAVPTVASIQSGLATPTNITAITGNITGNLSGSVGSVTGAVGSVTGAVGSVTGAVGSVTGAVGSVTGAVGSVTAAVTVGTINANVVNASALAADAVAEIADGIWDEATSGHTTSGTYGGRIVRATNANVEVQITGSNHVAADVHAFQTDVIDSAAIAASAVAEIQSGLATAANLLIVSDGVGFLTSVMLGTISDAGTAGETYVITFGGATYTLDYTGLDATGNRTGVTRTKV